MRRIQLRLTTVAFLLGAALTMRGQGEQPRLVGLPQYGVTLSGSPEVPVIVNHTGRTIIGFNMSTYMVDGGKGPAAGLLLVYSRAAAIVDGAQYQPPGATDKKDARTMQIPAAAQRPSVVAVSPLPIVKAVLDGVLFDDGEYVGPGDDFFQDATRKIGAYREVGKRLTAVKYGSDPEIAAVWSKFEEMPGRNYRKQLGNFARDPVQRDSPKSGPEANRNRVALDLLEERDFRGERLAFDLAEYFAALPDPWRKK